MCSCSPTLLSVPNLDHSLFADINYTHICSNHTYVPRITRGECNVLQASFTGEFDVLISHKYKYRIRLCLCLCENTTNDIRLNSRAVNDSDPSETRERCIEHDRSRENDFDIHYDCYTIYIMIVGQVQFEFLVYFSP